MTIITPYRDRPDHLSEFLRLMARHDIYIIEQADNKPFNRGKLINVGFLEVRPLEFVANDVDMITEQYPPSLTHGVVQCARNNIQVYNYLGGSTLYSSFSFRKAQGYHNDFFHRAEDNEMMFNLRYKNIPVFHVPQTFLILPHPRTGPEFIPELWEKAQHKRTVNMLDTCKYEVVARERKVGYTLIKVLL